jgi:hypothetical protein
VNGTVIKKSELVPNSFSSDFLTVIKTMNNVTEKLIKEDAAKYLAEQSLKSLIYKSYTYNSK